MKRALRLSPLLLVFGACSGKGNTGQPERNFTFCVDGQGRSVDCTSEAQMGELKLWEQVPWANRATPQIAEDGAVKVSALPVYPPISAHTPDMGSREVDCSSLDGIELSPYYVDTFEPLSAANVGMAPGWSSYDDGSDASFRVPGDIDWYPGLALRTDLGPYGMPAQRHDALPGARPACDGAPNDWVLHYRGGRFNYYGGGMSHPLAAEHTDRATGTQLAHGCPEGSDLCPEAGPDGQPSYDIFGVPPATFPTGQPHEFWDVSKYDGVTFWARRGPDGSTSMLVGLQNKYTSDDLARDNERFCKRLKVCAPRCINGYECRINESLPPPAEGDAADEEYLLERCMPPNFNVGSVTNPALREFLFPRCGQSTCKPPVFYPDKAYEGTTCNATEFTANDAGYWCSSEERPVPAYAERCGDGFVAPVTLSTDWQLYKLPFDAFKQVGFGRVAPSFDLKSLYSIAFQFTVGYTDVYVDNVSFYRNK